MTAKADRSVYIYAIENRGKKSYFGESWETEIAVEILLKINIFTSTNFLAIGEEIPMFTFGKLPLCCQLHQSEQRSKYYIFLFT